MTTTTGVGVVQRDNSIFYSPAIQGNYTISPSPVAVATGPTINTIVVHKQQTQPQKVFHVR